MLDRDGARDRLVGVASARVTRLNVLRHIEGFHQDTEGDWVAELDCLHRQHVRHRPPFQKRPWVLPATAGRSGSACRIAPLRSAELPDHLTVARIVGPFDEDTMPPDSRKDIACRRERGADCA
jgi:tellurite methyltransferase